MGSYHVYNEINIWFEHLDQHLSLSQHISSNSPKLTPKILQAYPHSTVKHILFTTPSIIKEKTKM
jgi:hypothetical protein